MTKGQLVMLFIALCLKHSLNSSAMGDFLKLLNMVVPGCLPKSNYFLQKLYFHEIESQRTLYNFCPECKNTLVLIKGSVLIVRRGGPIEKIVFVFCCLAYEGSDKRYTAANQSFPNSRL